nr:MAG TPA: hypothetical protein [Caudoviricetes sp.]
MGKLSIRLFFMHLLRIGLHDRGLYKPDRIQRPMWALFLCICLYDITF